MSDLQTINKAGSENFILLQKVEDFCDWFYPIVDRYPKTEKFALCTEIKNNCYDMVRTIIKTNKSSAKMSGWFTVDCQLDTLRFLVRHSRKRGFLAIKSYETAAKKLAEIGKILGGLLRSQNFKKGT